MLFDQEPEWMRHARTIPLKSEPISRSETLRIMKREPKEVALNRNTQQTS